MFSKPFLRTVHLGYIDRDYSVSIVINPDSSRLKLVKYQSASLSFAGPTLVATQSFAALKRNSFHAYEHDCKA